MRRAQAGVLALAAASVVVAGCAICDPILKDPTISQALGSTPSGKGIDNIAHASQDAIALISPQDERAVGQASALKVIAESGGALLDGKLVAYVNEVGNSVAQQGKREALVPEPRKQGETAKDPKSEKLHARTAARRFFFGVVDDPSWNAYSLPGGYIFVTRGLLENMGSESELAFVLAHEVAHVDHEHGLAAIKAQVGASATASAFLKETNLTGSSGNGDISFQSDKFFGAIAGKLAELLLKVGLEKSAERVADVDGLNHAIAAGYDAHGAERVLNLLALNPNSQRHYLREHDTPEQRLQLLADAIAKARPGMVGMSRYEDGCVKNLENAVSQKIAAAATPAPSPTP